MMRLSLFVSVLAVTSVALAGCAADAEPTGSESEPNVAHIAPIAPVAPIDRTNDARQTGTVSDLLPHPSDAARAHQGETWSKVALELLPAERYGDLPSDSLAPATRPPLGR